MILHRSRRPLAHRAAWLLAAPLAWHAAFAQTPAAPATPAAAAASAPQPPATPASAHTLAGLFEDEGLPARLAASFDQIDARYAPRPDDEADPQRRARKQRLHAELSPWLRAQFDWSTRLLPMATAAYQRVLGEDEAQALRAYYRTPAGQTFVRQALPAVEAAQAALAQHIHAQVLAWQQAAVAGAGPLADADAPAPRSDHERQAGELILLLAPGETYRKLVQAKVQALESIEPHWPPETTRPQQAAWRQQISARVRAFEARHALPVLAQAVAARIPPGELAALLAAERPPARAAQRARTSLAAQALQKDLQDWQRQELLPAIQGRLLEALRDEAGARKP